MYGQKRNRQTYLLKCNGSGAGREYFLCRQNPEGGFHKIGSSYNEKTILYRLETAAGLGDTVIADSGDDGLALLVKDFAKRLDEIRFRKLQDAIQKGLHKLQKAPVKKS
jgi:hypothetical protein